MSEKAGMKLAGVAFAILLIAGVGFFSAYAAAGILYAPQQEAQSAAAVQITEPDPFASSTIIAKGAYVKDLTTGKVLFEQNADAQLPLASLTKIALVLSVIDVLPGDSVISTPAHYSAPPSGGTQRLPAGHAWKLSDAIDFTLTASSDDGATLLASAANDMIHEKYPQSPVQDATLWRMNYLAEQLGLVNTYFLNDTGLDLSSTQAGAYGSARDIATLLAYAASTSPSTFAATAEPTVTVNAQDGAQATAINTDKALSAIPGILMGKTGYTDLAGGNLAVVFNATPGHPVVAVVLGSTEDGRFSDMKQLVTDAQTAVEEGR